MKKIIKINQDKLVKIQVILKERFLKKNNNRKNYFYK